MVIAAALFGLAMALASIDAWVDSYCDTQWEEYDDCRRRDTLESCDKEVPGFCKDGPDERD